MKGKKGLWPFKTQGKTPQPELVLDPDPAGGEALLSPLAGAVVPLESVSDPVFAGKVLGDGLAVEPAEGMLYSPADGQPERCAPEMLSSPCIPVRTNLGRAAHSASNL